MAGRQHTLMTPEGVQLAFALPAVGERLVAFVLDCLIIAVAGFVLFLGARALGAVIGMAVFWSGFFVLRIFYFPWFEHRWQGRTPGKRWQKLHVIDHDGRALPAGAILARNLTREVEFALPLQMLLTQPFAMASGGIWEVLSAVWILALMLVAFLHPERRRIGDLIAGTIVVRKPELALLRDLAESPDTTGVELPDVTDALAASAPTARTNREPVFTPAQLAHYGEYELTVLESLLRQPDSDEHESACARVRAQIVAKIGWQGECDDDVVFLRAFYTAQRAHLEQRLLLGKRRIDKHDG